MKIAALVVLPDDVTTVTGPVVAPFGTVALICERESKVKVAETSWNLTSVTLRNPEPLIRIPCLPTEPELGENDMTERPDVGGGGGGGGGGDPEPTTKVAALVAEPAGVVTFHFPDAILFGTVAVIVVGELTVKFAP